MMSITGVSLVFRDELEELLNKPPVAADYSNSAKLSELIRNVREKFPEYRITGIILPLTPHKPVMIFAKKGEGSSTHVNVEPGSGAVIGVAHENSVLKFLQELHFNLLNGTTGRKVNAFGGITFIVLSITGISLFLRGASYCLHVFRMKNTGSRRVVSWSLHQKLGAILLPMFLTWGISAYSFGFHHELEKIVNLFLPVSTVISEIDKTRTSTSNLTNESLALASSSSDELELIDAAAELSMRQCPGQRLSRVALPGKKDSLVKFWLTNTNSNDKVDATEVDIDLEAKRAVAVVRPESRTTGDIFMVWLPRIHFGSFAGVASKIIWCFIGFAPLIMAITGLIMWSPTGKSTKIDNRAV